jgi:hypothetical protein
VVQSSAYLAAVAGGYTGTEEEFHKILADALTHKEADNSYVQKSNLATVAGQSLQDGGNVDLQINHISDLNDRLNNIDSAIESKQPILFKQSSNQGVYQVIDPLYPNSANGHYSFATGYRTEASGDRSHAEGEKTKATKRAAHAEGQDTEASGQNSHAEGYWSKATGTNSHAEGRSTIASGANSHAGGEYSEASGGVSFATGSHTKATNMYEFACGHYNKSDKDTIFSVGCGSNENSRQNAFELKNDKTAYV